MIVPRPRLLVAVATLALPLAVAAAALPERLVLAGLAALAAAATIDAFLAPRRLGGLDVILPETVRFLRDRQGTLEVRIRNDRPHRRRVTVGLSVPAGLGAGVAPAPVVLPAGPGEAVFPWTATPRRRGFHRIAAAHLEAASPLGFWSARRAVAVACEARVYPNLLAEGRAAAALLLRRAHVGLHAQRRVGKGREFESLRDYQPGDGYEDVHWKGTAKRGRPVTKVFQVERTQEVYAVVDASRLAAREQGEPKAPAIERFISAALLLARAAERQGDLFGLVAYSDRVVRFIRAGRGRAHFDACREALCGLEAAAVTPDFDEVATFLLARLRRRALLLFLTDLDDPVLAEEFLRGAGILARRHLVTATLLRPQGARPLFTGPDPAGLEGIYERLAGHLVWSDLQELTRGAQRRGATVGLFDGPALPTGAVARYLDVKRRQAL
jgi:uncharacterized protein (DUF58 family)